MSMKKHHELEQKLNSTLAQHELFLKLHGEHELTITGAPKNNLRSQLFLCALGASIVFLCLIIGRQNGAFNTFVIGGCLLGLIMVCSPFMSFYSKKYFQIYISRGTRQINVSKGIAKPYKRIDFSDIDAIFMKKDKDDDFINPEEGNLVNYKYTFGVCSGADNFDLLKFDTENEELDEFADEFATLLSEFIGRELRVV